MFKSRSSIRVIALAAAAVSFVTDRSVHAETTRIVLTGDRAPDGGEFSGDFSFNPTLNNTGQVSFTGFVAGVGRSVYRYDPSGRVDTLVLSGSRAPGGGVFQIPTATAIGGDGRVLFFDIYLGAFRADQFSVVPIFRYGSPAPDGGDVASLSNFGINDAGGAAVEGSTTKGDGMFFSDGVTFYAYAKEGDIAPGTGGGTFLGRFFRLGGINAAGQTAFYAGTTAGSGIFRGEGAGSVTAVARAGDTAPGGGLFDGFNGSRINESGRVAFFASLDGASQFRQGLYHGTSPSDIVPVVRQGDAAPDGGAFQAFTSAPFLTFNDANQIAFRASTTTTTGIFRGDGAELRSIARVNDLSPDGNGRFSSFDLPEIAAGGQVLFEAGLTDTAGGTTDDAAIVLSDGVDRVIVAREGQSREGSAIAALSVWTGFNFGGYTGLNDHGQVAYRATLADGRQGLYVFTPDLHWRSREDGNWQTPGAWTLNFRPDAPHAVFIDPAFDLTVTGPSSRTTIRRLEVGSPLSNAKATLRLSAGGELAVSDTLTVHPAGVVALVDGLLSGGTIINDGLIHLDGGSLNPFTLENRSLLIYDAGTIGGSFANTGTLRVNGILSAIVDNRGEIEIPAGGELDAGVSGMANFGMITLDGGSWRSSGYFSNFALVSGHGGLYGTSPLLNYGLLQVSGGALVSTGGIKNSGAVELGSTATLHIGGNQFENNGTVSLNGGVIVGSFSNRPGGVLVGPGMLGAATSNLGTFFVPHGTLNLVSDIANDGLVQLQGPSASIIGGAITNNRTIEGAGRIANAITNNGTIESGGGTLTLAGAVNNTPSGLISVPAGAKLLLPASPAPNAGTIMLVGGTFDTDGSSLNNAQSGLISGSGTLRTGGLQNSGTLGFSGGDSHVFGSLNNESGGKVVVSGRGRATFHSSVHNKAAAELRVSDGATAVFFGGVINDGGITGGGDKFFEGGISAVGALATTGTSAVAASASLNATHVRERSLTVRGAVTVTPNGSAAGTSVLENLDIAGDGVLDLTDNDLVIRADAATRTQRLRQLHSYVASARNASAGRWRGPGLTSSAAAASSLTTLAVGASGDDVLVRYTWNGDANLDGLVNADDYFRIDSGFLQPPPDPLFAQGDFNYDSSINADDYFLIDSAFLGQGAPLAPGAVPSIVSPASVPEPFLALPGLAATLFARRRGRRVPVGSGRSSVSGSTVVGGVPPARLASLVLNT